MNIPATLKASLDKEINRARRYNSVVSFVIIKLAGLKNERLMREVNSLLKDSLLRDIDIVKKISRRRFGLILPQTSRVRAFMACTRIKETLEKRFEEGISVHMGVSTYPFEALDAESLVKAAMEDLERNG